MLKKIGFGLAAIYVLSPWANPAIALITGFALTYFLGNPFQATFKMSINWMLKSAVVGLGFGIQAQEAWQAGKEGFLMTIVSISATMILGFFLAKWLHLNKRSGYLLSSGTAICGGSAIAAIAPIVRASQRDISMAMGTVFLLNSIALLIFPPIGHWLELSQSQFGIWSAIAIHDTSSVVGAASTYGAEALKIATTVKLARALWIIPLAIVTSYLFKGEGKMKYPWFIGLFVIAILLNSYLSIPEPLSTNIVFLARKAMTLTLFMVGANLSLAQIKSAGWPSLSLGLILWVTISVGSLLAILAL